MSAASQDVSPHITGARSDEYPLGDKEGSDFLEQSKQPEELDPRALESNTVKDAVFGESQCFHIFPP